MKIIPNTTEAAQTISFNINTDVQGEAEFTKFNFPIRTTFQITGGTLGESEYVTLEYLDGATWRVANIGGNAGKILDSNNALATIYGRMKNVRLKKSVTSTAIGVEVV